MGFFVFTKQIFSLSGLLIKSRTDALYATLRFPELMSLIHLSLFPVLALFSIDVRAERSIPACSELFSPAVQRVFEIDTDLGPIRHFNFDLILYREAFDRSKNAPQVETYFSFLAENLKRIEAGTLKLDSTKEAGLFNRISQQITRMRSQYPPYMRPETDRNLAILAPSSMAHKLPLFLTHELIDEIFMGSEQFPGAKISRIKAKISKTGNVQRIGYLIKPDPDSVMGEVRWLGSPTMTNDESPINLDDFYLVDVHRVIERGEGEHQTKPSVVSTPVDRLLYYRKGTSFAIDYPGTWLHIPTHSGRFKSPHIPIFKQIGSSKFSVPHIYESSWTKKNLSLEEELYEFRFTDRTGAVVERLKYSSGTGIFNGPTFSRLKDEDHETRSYSEYAAEFEQLKTRFASAGGGVELFNTFFAGSLITLSERYGVDISRIGPGNILLGRMSLPPDKGQPDQIFIVLSMDDELLDDFYVFQKSVSSGRGEFVPLLESDIPLDVPLQFTNSQEVSRFIKVFVPDSRYLERRAELEKQDKLLLAPPDSESASAPAPPPSPKPAPTQLPPMAPAPEIVGLPHFEAQPLEDANSVQALLQGLMERNESVTGVFEALAFDIRRVNLGERARAMARTGEVNQQDLQRILERLEQRRQMVDAAAESFPSVLDELQSRFNLVQSEISRLQALQKISTQTTDTNEEQSYGRILRASIFERHLKSLERAPQTLLQAIQVSVEVNKKLAQYLEWHHQVLEALYQLSNQGVIAVGDSEAKLRLRSDLDAFVLLWDELLVISEQAGEFTARHRSH